ncbi:MAG: hypothetical protein H6737_28105 [Alphaproteobacteria bacterium]|nr:hypothetical protein [Alphaproteobacteria bacterium]
MILLWIGAAHAACGDDAMTNAGFREAVDGAWASALDGQDAELRARLFEAEKGIACLPEPVTVEDAARFHRDRAIASRLSGDPKGAVAAASAAFQLAPELAPVWAQESEAFAALLDEAPPPGPIDEFPTSLAALVYTDGRPQASRPFGLPVLVQVFSPDGPPVGAQWIDARASMPDWVAFPPANCEGTVSVESLVQDVEVAESAFTSMDVEGFEASLRRIARGLPCVDQVLRPTQAAAIHRLEGLRLYTYGTGLGTVRSFQEAQQLDPAFVPPAGIVDEGSTLATLWERAGTVGSPPWLPVDVPEGVTLRVDGIVADARPSTQPSIVQAVSPTGRVLWTGYVPGGVPLPDLGWLAAQAGDDAASRLPPALALYRQDEAGRRRTNLGRGLQLGGAALLVGSGLAYGLNAKHVGEYKRATTPPEDLPEIRAAANRAATAGTALLVLGGVGIGASFVYR